MGDRYTGVFIVFDCVEKVKVDQFKDIAVDVNGLLEDPGVISFFISEAIARHEDGGGGGEDFFDDEED